MSEQRLYRAAKYLVIAAIVALSILHLLKAIVDNDFFWHLKTGEWIWQNRSLPERDPFAFTTQGLDTKRSHFVLTGFWASQLLYHLAHEAAGFPGIVSLRFLVVGFLLYFLWKVRTGDVLQHLGLLLVSLVAILGIYPLDRPQVFSFLFFAVLLYLLRWISGGTIRRAACFLLPLLMLVWANMHPGYVLGIAIVILYLAMEGVKFLHPALMPMGKGQYRILYVSGMSGIAVSLANPNAWWPLVEITTPKPDAPFNTEYLSVPEALSEFHDWHFAVYLFLLFLSVCALCVQLFRKRMNITEAALLIGTGYFSFTAIRYVAFFVIAALPVIADVSWDGKSSRWFRGFLCAVALSLGSYSIWEERQNVRIPVSGAWVDGSVFPVGAADFVVKNDPGGNMYNYWPWGGYLMWRLGPERKVFFDGRHLSYELFGEARRIDNAERFGPAGTPGWKTHFEAFGIQYTVTPFFTRSSFDGTVVPLVSDMLRDSDWTQVFFDGHSIVFRRTAAAAGDLPAGSPIRKEEFVDGLILEFTRMIGANPGSPLPYITLGDLLSIRSKRGEAREAYRKALEVDPMNGTARRKLETLR